jgi:uncharacterized protein
VVRCFAAVASRRLPGDDVRPDDCRFSCLFGIILIVSVLSMSAQRAGACPFTLDTTLITVKDQPLVVELAVTPQARACGLSNRSVLENDHGMLFVYSGSGMRTYWMKDTRIALSIAFLDDGGKIINIESMIPNQTEIKYRSLLPARYVLEVNQGWFRRHGIKTGDRVVISAPAGADGH